MTVGDLKAEAAKLPPDDRFALAAWIEQNEDVRALRREELIREIQHGIGQADRGELHEADEVFARLDAASLAGKFNAMAERAVRDAKAGKCTPLDEFLRRA